MDIFVFLLCIIGSILIFAMLLAFLAIRVVPNDARLTVYRFGEKIGEKGPGIVFLIPFIDKGELKKNE